MKLFFRTLWFLVPLGHPAAAGRAEGPSDCHLASLPIELRDLVFLSLSLVDYSNVLATSKQALTYRASDHVVLELMRRAAEETEQLELAVAGERGRIMDILSSLHVVIGHHLCLLSSHAEQNIEPSEVTGLFHARFSAVAELSSRKMWKRACMTGLLPRGELGTLYLSWSPDFFLENVRHLLFAAVATGNLDILKASFDPLPAWILRPVCQGIALCGSMELLEAVQTRVPAIIQCFEHLLVAALQFGRERFFRQVWPLALESLNEQQRSEIIREVFAEACATGALGVVEDLFNYTLPAWKQEDLANGLDEAARNGHLPVLKFLVFDESGQVRCDIAISDLQGPLLRAAEHDRSNVIEYFLLDWDDQHRETLKELVPSLLTVAAREAAFKTLGLLLGRDRRGEALAPRLELPAWLLRNVVNNGRLDVLEYLLGLEKTDPRLNRISWAVDDNILLKSACFRGHLPIVQFLLRIDEQGVPVLPGIDPGAEANHCLRSACQEGHFNIVKELLRTDEEDSLIYQTIQPGSSNNHPLITAASHGRVNIVRFLLQKKPRCDGYLFAGIDPAARDQSALRLAAENGHLNVIRLLLKRDAHQRPLHPGVAIPRGLLAAIAWSNGYVEVMKVLLQHPIANRATEIHDALEEAAANNSHSMISILQEALNKCGGGRTQAP